MESPTPSPAMESPIPAMEDCSQAQGFHFSTLEVIRLLLMSTGLLYFIYLIVADALTSLLRKPSTAWISGKTLILSAFTIEVLSYLDYKNINISDKQDPYKYAELLGNQKTIDSGRLVICVFIGYLLPGMARPGSTSQWGDISALVISLFSAITSELFYLSKSNKLTSQDYNDMDLFYWHLVQEPQVKLWFMVSSLVVLALTTMLILLLVSANLAATSLRGMLAMRIKSVIDRSSNADFSDWSSDENLKSFEDDIMKSWVLCRVGNPQYVIARTVLSSSVAALVTFYIMWLMFKVAYVEGLSYSFSYCDGWDWLRTTTFGLQCIFAFVGWIVIFWRSLTSVMYYPRSFSSPRRGRDRIGRCFICVVEDFWIRSISQQIDIYDSHRWPQNQVHARKSGNNIFWFATALKFHKLLYIPWFVQIVMVLFSKCCWIISWMLLRFITSIVFRCKFTQRLVLIDKLNNLYFQDETLHPQVLEDNQSDPLVPFYREFLKYKDALQHMCMPGEYPAALWLANGKAFRQAQEQFKKGNHKEWDHLTSLINYHLHPNSNLCELEELDPVKEYFSTLNENCWKITTVSLLRIIIKISSLNQNSDLNLESAIEACNQAWDLMTFANEQHNEDEFLGHELHQVRMCADDEFIKLIDNNCLNKDKFGRGRDHSAHQVIENLLQTAEQELKEDDVVRAQPEVNEVCIPRDAVSPDYNMFRVCKLILEDQKSHGDVNSVLAYLYDLLGCVIRDCLGKLPYRIVQRCRDWAVDSEEEKIWEAIYIAGKTKVVLSKASLIRSSTLNSMPVQVQNQNL